MASGSKEIHKKFGHQVRIRVCGILIQNDQLLMVKHRGLGEGGYLWIPPGGGLHFNENIPQSLAREFLEETGLIVEIGRFLFVHEYIGHPLHAVELFFEVVPKGGLLRTGYDPELAENQIIEEVKFVSTEFLQKEGNEKIHQRFHDLREWQELYSNKGYFKFVKNSLK